VLPSEAMDPWPTAARSSDPPPFFKVDGPLLDRISTHGRVVSLNCEHRCEVNSFRPFTFSPFYGFPGQDSKENGMSSS